jgi:hypothetical protein
VLPIVDRRGGRGCRTGLRGRCIRLGNSFPCDDNEDAFYLTGHAAPVGDVALERAGAAQFLSERGLADDPPGFGDGEFVEFRSASAC